MSSSIIKWATWSQLIQLYGRKTVPVRVPHSPDFLPTELDQLTSSGAFFSLVDWTLPFYVIFILKKIRKRISESSLLYETLSWTEGENPPKPIYTKYTAVVIELADFFHPLGTGALHIQLIITTEKYRCLHNSMLLAYPLPCQHLCACVRLGFL
jgi:hypothetical protein